MATTQLSTPITIIAMKNVTALTDQLNEADAHI